MSIYLAIGNNIASQVSAQFELEFGTEVERTRGNENLKITSSKPFQSALFIPTVEQQVNSKVRYLK